MRMTNEPAAGEFASHQGARIRDARSRLVAALDRQSRSMSIEEFAADQRAYDSAMAELEKLGCDPNAEEVRAANIVTEMEGREI